MSVSPPAKRGVPVVAFVIGGVVALALVLCLGAVVVGLVLYRGQQAQVQAQSSTGSTALDWRGQLTSIEGVVDYQAQGKLSTDHSNGRISYPQNPPVGGAHNPRWQDCSGMVYDAPIANEHAVHSLEHGAVWVVYRSGLSAADVRTLAQKVTGRDYLMLSPMDGLDTTVSLQAWGYQLKVGAVDDPRIDAFIKAARVNASLEPGASCSGGVTATGTTPQGGEGGTTF